MTPPLEPLEALPLEDQHALIASHLEVADRSARVWFYRWAKRYEFDELAAVARVGLVLAARTYHPDRGAAFRTWAYYHTNSAVKSFRFQELRACGWSYRRRAKPGDPVVGRDLIRQLGDWPPRAASGEVLDTRLAPDDQERDLLHQQRLGLVLKHVEADGCERVIVLSLLADEDIRQADIARTLGLSQRRVSQLLGGLGTRVRESEQVH